MHNIDSKLRNADGTIDTEAAMAAGRKARAEAAGAGFKAVCEIARHLFRAGKPISNAVIQPTPSRDDARG